MTNYVKKLKSHLICRRKNHNIGQAISIVCFKLCNQSEFSQNYTFLKDFRTTVTGRKIFIFPVDWKPFGWNINCRWVLHVMTKQQVLHFFLKAILWSRVRHVRWKSHCSDKFSEYFHWKSLPIFLKDISGNYKNLIIAKNGTAYVIFLKFLLDLRMEVLFFKFCPSMFGRILNT